jgi:2-polyprenyl-3-methyl-5-hydroxy-6-metoxy-1,4-benzoquinol methylase
MNKIKTIEKSNCIACGSKGELLYEKIEDRFFHISGQWNFFKCKNQNCNLIWLNPVPVKEDIHIAYIDYYTHSNNAGADSIIRKFYKKIQSDYLSAKYGYDNGEKKSFLKNILYLDPDRHEQTKYEVMYLENIKGRLLDIGCGNGEFLSFMKNYGWDTIGIDFDTKAVEVAKAKKLNVKLGSLKEQNFTNDYFDAITVAHVLEHVYNPTELLAECYKLLKTNGKVIVATPNSQSLGHKFFKENWRGLEPPRHIHVFSPKSLFSVIQNSGFKKFKLFTIGRISRSIFMSSRGLNQKNNFSKFKARLFSTLEWGLIKIKIKCGEEIIIIAEK